MRHIRLRHVQAQPERQGKVRQAQQLVRSQLSWAAGGEFFQQCDPVGYVTESFRQTFDAFGRQAAGGQSDSFLSAQTGKNVRTDEDARTFYERGSPEEQGMLRKFSEIAFQRGVLAGAVLRGSGKLMLFSCLKKTVGQSQPVRWQQRKLFEQASHRDNMSGYGTDQVTFNRGFTESAVGLAISSLKNARRIVEQLSDLAQGKSGMSLSVEAQTLRTMYPFLDDNRERGLLKMYQSRLQETGVEDPGRAVIQNAVVRTSALIEKKAQMRAEFVEKLRFLSDRATQVLDEWEQPDFSGVLDTALRSSMSSPEPPEDGENEHGEAGPGPPRGGAGPGEGAGDAAEPGP